MILLTLAASLIGVSFFWQWLAPSADRPEAMRGFPTVATVLCACIALLGYLPTWLDDRAAAKAAQAASALVGEPVEFECGSRLGVFFDRHTDMARGYVRWTADGPEKSSKLRFETCEGLRAFLSDGR